MLASIIFALPLLASAAAGSQHGTRHARHARHAEHMATRSNASPVPIFNNALLQSRAQIISEVARRDDEFVMEKRGKNGKRVRVMRRKVQTCKAADGSTSQIGHEALGQGGSAAPTNAGASASVTAAPAPSASGSDDGAEQAWSSAVASISSLHSEAGYPTDWAGPSATSAGSTPSSAYSASATAPVESSAAPSVTASPSYSGGAASSEAPAPSASSGGDASMLFPVGRGLASWTTQDGMSRKYDAARAHFSLC